MTSILYTIHYILYTIHCTIHYTPYTIHYKVYTIHYKLYTLHYTLYDFLEVGFITFFFKLNLLTMPVGPMGGLPRAPRGSECELGTTFP